MKKTINLIIAFLLMLPAIAWSQGCEPYFDYYKRGNSVVFYNDSKGSISPWYEWNFGDGSGWQYDVEHYVIKTYTQNGTYLVCLRDSFCTTKPMHCDSVKITGTIPIYADFSYTLESTGKITLYNNATSSEGDISHYYWDLGDGSVMEGENDSLVYNYHASGTYNVCMHAFDDAKNYNYQCSTVVVTAADPCFAAFSSVLANGEYYFLNQSVFPGDSATWLWDFGDSSSSTLANPKHTYANPGNYNVRLTLNGPCNSTYAAPVYYPGPGQCELSVSGTAINQRATFTISDTSAFPSIYYIEFGDGQTTSTTEKVFYHTYADTGDYVVLVHSYNPICGEVYAFNYLRINSVEPICNATFFAYPGDTATNKVYVINTSQIASNGSNKSYITILWGDGKSDIDSNNTVYFEHDYDSAGIYTIRMIVSNQVSCADTSFKSVGVGPTYLVSGRVMQGGKPAAYNYISAYMFEPQSGLLSYGEATLTNDSGYYEMYLRKGYYIIQSDFAFDPTMTEFYLPTYYGDKLNWTSSDVLTIVGNRSGLDINQIPFNPMNQGNGKIAGSAVFGRNVKLNGETKPEGMPAEKMLIFLLDGQGKAVGFTHTDAKGHFEFSNVMAGNYTVWAEMPGKMTIPPYVSLANHSSTADNLKIIIGQNSVTSIFDQKPIENALSFEMYPNPSSDLVNIQLAETSGDIAAIELIDITGKTVNVTQKTDKKIASIDVSGLQNGAYFVKVTDNNGMVITKKLMRL